MDKSDDTYEFDAHIVVMAVGREKLVAAEKILEYCLDGDIAISLHEPKGVFSDGFVSEILTLLDRIEIENDSSLANQRFAIADKHGLTVNFHDELMVVIGENIKVLLPGERPWVKVIEESGSRFKGRILNKLFRELSEHEQARFMKRETGTVQALQVLPELHTFKQGDEVWFQEGTDEQDGWWIPVEKGQDYG